MEPFQIYGVVLVSLVVLSGCLGLFFWGLLEGFRTAAKTYRNQIIKLQCEKLELQNKWEIVSSLAAAGFAPMEIQREEPPKIRLLVTH